MKTKYFEYIAVYLSVFLVCIFIGAIARFVMMEMGADDYTANVFFWIGTGFGILTFAILSLFLNDLADRLLSHFVEVEKNELVESKNLTSDIEQIREKQQNVVKNQKQFRIDATIRYTQQQFAPYTADDDLKQLVRNIIIYAEEIDFEKIKPVKVNVLSNLDLYHFGWNLWNCFKVSRQDRAAQFLKLTFADALKDVEENSIKTHLKDDEQKGLIKIMEDLADF